MYFNLEGTGIIIPLNNPMPYRAFDFFKIIPIYSFHFISITRFSRILESARFILDVAIFGLVQDKSGRLQNPIKPDFLTLILNPRNLYMPSVKSALVGF